jgi:hypothetical protein
MRMIKKEEAENGKEKPYESYDQKIRKYKGFVLFE